MEEIKEKIKGLEEAYHKNIIFVKNNIDIEEIINDLKYLINKITIYEIENEKLKEENKKLKKKGAKENDKTRNKNQRKED